MAKSFFKKAHGDKPVMPKKKFQPRHWMPAPDEGEKPDPKEDAQHMIVTHRGEPVGFYEHQVKINGDWRNWFTCLTMNEIGDRCPLCEHGEYRAYWAGAMTVLNITPFDTKNGENKGRRQLVIAKNEMLGRFELWTEEDGNPDSDPRDLYGVQYRVLRSSGDAANIGDDWKKRKLWTAEELEKHFAEIQDEIAEQDWDGAEEEAENLLEMLDYEEIFAPCTVEELEGVVAAIGPPSKGKKTGRGSKTSHRKKSKGVSY